MSKEKISFINIITCRCVFLLILQPCHFESACVVADSQSVSCRVFTCFKRICVKVAYVRQRGTWPLAPPLPLAFPLTVERDQRTWRPQCVASCGRESNRRVAPPPFRPPLLHCLLCYSPCSAPLTTPPSFLSCLVDHRRDRGRECRRTRKVWEGWPCLSRECKQCQANHQQVFATRAARGDLDQRFSCNIKPTSYRLEN